MDFDSSDGTECFVENTGEFWKSLGSSRDRKYSVSQILRNDFCEGGHLETAEDAPDSRPITSPK